MDTCLTFARMRHVAAYLLLALGGNENPTADDVTDLLSSVGIEPDQKCLKESRADE